tara:strand:- start:1308 stop:1673 length:366 start_codon:yes stop_codon:yes gene_type:complete
MKLYIATSKNEDPKSVEDVLDMYSFNDVPEKSVSYLRDLCGDDVYIFQLRCFPFKIESYRVLLYDMSGKSKSVLKKREIIPDSFVQDMKFVCAPCRRLTRRYKRRMNVDLRMTSSTSYYPY